MLQAYPQTHIGTVTVLQAHNKRREPSRGKRAVFERIPSKASVLRKWSYHDKGWKSNNGFITFPHVSLHREKEASSVLIRPLGKNMLCIILWGQAQERASESEGRRESIFTRQPKKNHTADTSAADSDGFDRLKTVVCIGPCVLLLIIDTVRLFVPNNPPVVLCVYSFHAFDDSIANPSFLLSVLMLTFFYVVLHLTLFRLV